MTPAALRRWSGWLFALPYLLAFGAFMAWPLGYGLVLSFMRWEMLSPAPPHAVGFGNYAEALGDPQFWRALWATVRFVVLAVPATVAFALLVAIAVHRVTPRRQTFYRAAVFLPVLISISVAAIMWRWFFNSEFGLFNAWLAPLGWKLPWITHEAWAMKSVVLMTLWWTLGGPVVILLAGLGQVPRHYYEAAAIDGASDWQQFLHVTLPVLRPVLLFIVVMQTIASFQVFGQTFLITMGGPEQSTRVLVHYIYDTAFTHYRMGYGAAMSWLLFVCIAVFSIVQFRWLRER